MAESCEGRWCRWVKVRWRKSTLSLRRVQVVVRTTRPRGFVLQASRTFNFAVRKRLFVLSWALLWLHSHLLYFPLKILLLVEILFHAHSRIYRTLPHWPEASVSVSTLSSRVSWNRDSPASTWGLFLPVFPNGKSFPGGVVDDCYKLKFLLTTKWKY